MVCRVDSPDWHDLGAILINIRGWIVVHYYCCSRREFGVCGVVARYREPIKLLESTGKQPIRCAIS